jgi:hypothetical protein
MAKRGFLSGRRRHHAKDVEAREKSIAGFSQGHPEQLFFLTGKRNKDRINSKL